MKISEVDFGQGPVPWYEFPGTRVGLPDAHFASANGLPAQSYRSLLEQFSDELNLSTMNARGAWAEIPPPEKFSWLDHTADLIAAIETSYQHPIIGIGHSFGGAQMIMAAAQRPELFSRIIAIEPASTPSRWFDLLLQLAPSAVLKRIFPMVTGSHERKAVWQSPQAFFDNYRHHSTFKRFTDSALRDYAEHGLVQRAQGDYQLLIHPHWESHIFSNTRWLWRHVRKLRVPTLLIKAEHTYLYTQASFERECARLGQHIDALTIADSGHLLTHEIPAELHGHILAWMK